MQHKVCFKCNQNKPLEAYYKHKMMADGHLNKCKECAKSDTMNRYNVLINDPDWYEKEQARGRSKYHRYKYKSKGNGQFKHKIKFPEKETVRRLGIHKKMKIEKGFHGHHWSYNLNHALDVIILSSAEHSKAHRFLIYDQPTMKYKTRSGALLDTKEKHEEYIRKMISTMPD